MGSSEMVIFTAQAAGKVIKVSVFPFSFKNYCQSYFTPPLMRFPSRQNHNYVPLKILVKPNHNYVCMHYAPLIMVPDYQSFLQEFLCEFLVLGQINFLLVYESFA